VGGLARGFADEVSAQVPKPIAVSKREATSAQQAQLGTWSSLSRSCFCPDSGPSPANWMLRDWATGYQEFSVCQQTRSWALDALPPWTV
jgi:hypothetical protein